MAGDAMVVMPKCLSRGCRFGRGSHVHAVCGQHQAFLFSPTISVCWFTEKPKKCPARYVFLYQNCQLELTMVMTPRSFLVYSATGSPINVTQRCVTPSKSQPGSVGLSGSFYQPNQFLDCHRRFRYPFVVI